MPQKDNKNNEKPSGFLDWFRNATLGAAMAEAPAIMTASGWRLNEKGDYVLDLQDKPEIKLLRSNLVDIGVNGVVDAAGFPAVYGLYRYGLKTTGKAGSKWARAKLISEAIDESTRNITSKTPNSTLPRFDTVEKIPWLEDDSFDSDHITSLYKAPVLKKLENTPNFKSYTQLHRPKVKFDDDIGTDIRVIGVITPGNSSKNFSKEIVRRANAFGDVTRPLASQGNKTGKQVILETTSKPMFAYISKKGKATGFYVPSYDESYIRIYGDDLNKITSTAHHENVMHKTDDVVNDITHGTALRMYENFTNKLTNEDIAIPTSKNWEEARATSGELVRDLYYHLNKTKLKKPSNDLDIESLRHTFNKYVDDMSLNELGERLRGINAYGEDYARHLWYHPEDLKHFKTLLKYAPVAGAPVVTKQEIPQHKKGAKIAIKKENRGKFTEYCGGKVTNECILKGKNSPDPKIRKRATFALNARKFKHN